MAFIAKLPDAARRHLQAAEMLCAEPGHRKDVAGYLYGIAAECAVKHMIAPLPLPAVHDKDKIWFAHFPELRTLLRDALEGRRRSTGALYRFVFDDSFMNNWHISMRYSDARQIRDEWIRAWKAQAKDAVSAMDT
ncbi:hypothetical protein [Polyangium mundeleinium]|uniref:HEPN domain-containing protein n=1 Tax=Polyangium mundeleinium TaxID=2995306 RepID=A0ABT5F8Z1_9BACT|nr:hypothetical protein [Polyangium mundeleinium]MDC0749591.1 hypothetical protein [Polyangium mundeleinium]